MKTLIVTGGAGFIGTNFVRYALNNTDYRVVVLDKLTYAGSLLSLKEVENNDRYVFEQADIADLDVMQTIYTRYQPDRVVNFAAETHVDRSIDGPEPFVRTNLVGTWVMLEAARRFLKDHDEATANAFRLLHVSTDEVYGELGETGLFHETTPYAPSSPYSASKAGADHMVYAYYRTYGMNTLITNCSNNYGPFQFPEKLIPVVILNALEAKDLRIYGDGSNIRDWLYVEDHCSGILKALEDGQPGRNYNIGGRNERTNLQIIDRICELLEKNQPAAENPAMQDRGLNAYTDLKTFVDDRPGHDRRYAIDADRIRDELGWEPKHNFDSGIEHTVKWYLDNLDWCRDIQAEKDYHRERLGTGE